MADGAVEDRHRIAAEHAAPVFAQAPQRQQAVEPGAALRPRVHQVHRAVVVPERAGVDPAARGCDQGERLPRATRIHCCGHEDPDVGIAGIHPETAGVMTEARRPDAHPVLRLVVPRRGQPRRCVADDRPGDQIARVQDRQRRDGGEARRHQVEVLADADDVGIRVVAEDDRVPVDRCLAAAQHGGHDGEREQRHPVEAQSGRHAKWLYH